VNYKLSMKKRVRSISGILPLTVVLKSQKCKHGKCIYCPTQENIPESYTSTSAPILRAIDCNYDPVKQVKARLKIYKLMGHPTDKIELIVLGGTFTDYDVEYQKSFIKGCFDGLNGVISKTLSEAQKINETAQNRCVTMCLETRPDGITKENINNMLGYGCTRIEIGVQCLDNEIYQLVKRGHIVEDVINAFKLLKDSGFKVGVHMMLGLPGSNPEKDFQMFKKLFNDPDFKPDQIKIYPTFVIKGTELERLYKKGEYEPYTTEQIVDLVIKIKQIVPKYVRIMKIMRDIPAQHIISECRYSHLRDEINKKLEQLDIKCPCIRCREVGHLMRKNIEIDSNFKLERINYDASGGKEIFLSFESSNAIASLLRLRIPGNSFRPEITEKTAIIRELHTYGPVVPIGENGQFWQHKGFGKKLVKEAERIAKQEFDCNKMVIISGVGVRRYFIDKLGYKLDGPYVSKKL